MGTARYEGLLSEAPIKLSTCRYLSGTVDPSTHASEAFRPLPLPIMQFPWTESEGRDGVHAAVKHYWSARASQGASQGESSRRVEGTRGEVLGGQHLNGFSGLLIEVIRAAGFRDEHIRQGVNVDLPGYYRATKKWDIVVARGGKLCAAIEMKSQVGPSFGNNFNNRSEEAIGSSHDFWVAYREGALGTQRPWLGYFLLVEEHPKSTSTVKLANAVFEPMPAFHKTSYIDRYAILCQRLVLERNYSSAAFLTAPRADSGAFTEPDSTLGFFPFARSLFGHLVGVA